MAFLPTNYDEGNLVSLPIGAETFTNCYGCLFDPSGQMVQATPTGGVPIFYVIMEDVAVAPTAGAQEALFVRTINVPIFEVDTSGTPTQAQMGTYMDTVTNAGTIDEDASADDLFFAEKIISAADKKVQGWFKGFTVEA
jgi:hypothetical protein